MLSNRKTKMVMALIVCAAVFASVTSASVRSPSSSGPVATLDEPVFRIPRTHSPPVIDGVMEEGEWEDASALSSCWYHTSGGRMGVGFLYLAPVETQIQVYAMYDDDNLYIAYSSPVYPEGSWLRTHGRFPNVLNHPRYGVQRDDKIELEIRPYRDAARGYELGLLKWTINPIDTVADFYWSTQYGWRFGYDSGIKARSSVTDTRWTIEMAIPHEGLVEGLFDGYDEDGSEIVTIPPPDGTVYRTWFNRGIGGIGPFFIAFDQHVWNTTKTRMIFDSNAVAFQINELGPIMEDIIDVHVTVKNHSSRSESVRIGFFVESADGLVYSSYEDDELTGGVLELIPGEMRQLRLRQPFPGISERGNVLWFDVRSAGTPAKPIFLTRLVDFHTHEIPEFREDYIDVIADLRPPRQDFDLRFDFCPHESRLAAVIDRGIHGSSEEAQTATEARIGVLEADSGDEIASNVEPFHGDFSIVKLDLPPLEKHEYELSVLLFDADRRIVADASRSFNRWGMPNWVLNLDEYTKPDEYLDSELGLDDTVWEPYTPLEVTEDGFSGLKHVFTLHDSGLPAQIYIKPTDRVLPLELRGPDVEPDDEQLVELGRGPLLRAPVRLEAVVEGQRYEAEVIEPANLVKQWESELEYRSKLRVGPVDVALQVQYDCDGSWHVTMDYGSDGPQVIESLEMITDVRGPVDMATGGTGGGGMAGSPVFECSLPDYEGIVWDITTQERGALRPTFFSPWFHFGSGDRGLSWMNDTNRGWGLDRDGSIMQLERNAEGEVAWRVQFVNHPFDIEGERRIEFSIMTHPAKPKPDGYRRMAWHYRGSWAAGFAYHSEPLDLSEEYLRRRWRTAAGAPDHIPFEEAHTWRKETPPWAGYGQERPKSVPSENLEYTFEQRVVHMVERQIRVGRRHGYWWDEYWPTFGSTDNLASGYAAFKRDLEEMAERDDKAPELPWVSGHATRMMRSTQKRLARFMADNNVPNRCQHHWANASANSYEGLGFEAQLIEGAGSNHRSFDLDMRTRYPMSLYKALSNSFTGLVVRHAGGATPARPGDDRRLDRQWIGPPLLHDIGVSPSSSCGTIQHLNEVLRTIDIIDEFGYFDDAGTEFLPYWRNQDVVRWGEGRKRYAPRVDLHIREPDEQLYVSVYRRSFQDENGRSGCKVLLVLVNDYREDVTADLTVLKPELVFGGPNTLTRGDVIARYRSDYGRFADLLADWTPHAGVPVLLDLESGSMVELTGSSEGETYGSVHVPKKNFRLLYGHFLE